jgi:hypothetical protein
MASVASYNERRSLSSIPKPLRLDQSSSTPSSPSPLSSNSLRRQSSISYKPSDSEATFVPRSPASGAVAAAGRPESSRRHSSYISGAAINGAHGKTRDAVGKDRPLTLVEKYALNAVSPDDISTNGLTLADMQISLYLLLRKSPNVSSSGRNLLHTNKSSCSVRFTATTMLLPTHAFRIIVKKKWEQIMLRGGSQYTTSPSIPPSNVASAYPDSSASTPMFQGIKEGVRLLAAATSLATPSTPVSPLIPSSTSLSSQTATSSKAPQRRPTSMYGSVRHVQNDSASTSTSTSRSVDTTRFSLSSQSSLGWEDAAGSSSNKGQELIVPETEYPEEETPTTDMVDGSEPSSLGVHSASTARVSFDTREDVQSGLVRRRSRGNRGTASSTSSSNSGDTAKPMKSASNYDRNSAPAGGATSWMDSVGKKWGELSSMTVNGNNNIGTPSSTYVPSRTQRHSSDAPTLLPSYKVPGLISDWTDSQDHKKERRLFSLIWLLRLVRSPLLHHQDSNSTQPQHHSPPSNDNSQLCPCQALYQHWHHPQQPYHPSDYPALPARRALHPNFHFWMMTTMLFGAEQFFHLPSRRRQSLPPSHPRYSPHRPPTALSTPAILPAKSHRHHYRHHHPLFNSRTMKMSGTGDVMMMVMMKKMGMHPVFILFSLMSYHFAFMEQ